MSEYEKLESEFEDKVQALRNSCSHGELTDWIEEWWAIAHPTGRLVKACKRCGKIVEAVEGGLKSGPLTV